MAPEIPPRSNRAGEKARPRAAIEEISASEYPVEHRGVEDQPSVGRPGSAIGGPRSVFGIFQQGLFRNGRCAKHRWDGLCARAQRPQVKIQRITLREIRMPLVTPFETSFGRVTNRRMLLVEAQSDGFAGWGECVAGEGPFYAPETVETAWHILRDFIWPLLKGRDFESAAEVWATLDTVRGHNMA